MLKGLIKTQLKTLKKVTVEMISEKDQSKSRHRIKDQDIQERSASLVLENLDTGEITQLNFKL